MLYPLSYESGHWRKAWMRRSFQSHGVYATPGVCSAHPGATPLMLSVESSARRFVDC